MGTDYSRGLLLGSTAAGTDESGLRHRLESTSVHVTAEIDDPGIVAALSVLMANLRRLPLQLSLQLIGNDLEAIQKVRTDVEVVVAGIDPDRLIGQQTLGNALRVHLGTRPAVGSKFSAVPDGHGVRFRRAGHPYPALRAPGSGLGAVLTAAVLTGEVFKRVTGLRAGAMQIPDKLDFCPVTLTDQPGSFSATPKDFPPLALIGAGAIGTAIALILKGLSATGLLTVVDPQAYEGPNVTTYSLGTRADADRGLSKVDLIKRELTNFDVTQLDGTAQNLLDQIDSGAAAWPKVVLGAVDNIPARHELQRIYADLTLDGGTGGRAGTTLALREGLPSGPCVRCYYPMPTGARRPSAEQLLHLSTGLPMERIARGQSLLTEDDLANLPEAGRHLLASHIGKPVCGLATLLGLVDGGDDYQPSAAFVAQQAAALVVGALIAREAGVVQGAMRDVEYDALHGPYAEMVTDRRPRAGCSCETDAALIEQIRSVRRHGAA